MTTIRQNFSPSKANELFARLVDTSDSAVKTRERLFGELKTELELLASLEEQHLFPALRKHKDTKDLVADAVNGNKQTRKLVAELERTPKDGEEFASKVAELRKTFQQHVRDERKELLPAVLKALSEEEARAIVEKMDGARTESEEAKRAEAEGRRAEARREREEAEKAAAAEQEARDRAAKARKATKEAAEAVARTGEAAAEASRKAVTTVAEGAGRLAAAPFSTGSTLWDSMFGMWGIQPGRSVGLAAEVRSSDAREEVIPLAEETLIVGKRKVESGTTTVRRYVVESPAEQQVELYDEKVVVERRRPVTDKVTGEVLTEVTVEMIETSEKPLVAKGVRIREEVVVRRERTRRVETVRDTVRRDEIEVEQTGVNGRAGKKRLALADGRK